MCALALMYPALLRMTSEGKAKAVVSTYLQSFLIITVPTLTGSHTLLQKRCLRLECMDELNSDPKDLVRVHAKLCKVKTYRYLYLVNAGDFGQCKL